VNEQKGWFPELEFFSKDKMGSITGEQRHSKLEDVAGKPIYRSCPKVFSTILQRYPRQRW
jgi:hypothetical protein